MTKVEQLESGIMALSRHELSALGKWFQSYLADAWDNQIEQDAKAGKIDRLARQALTEHKKGRTRPL